MKVSVFPLELAKIVFVLSVQPEKSRISFQASSVALTSVPQRHSPNTLATLAQNCLRRRISASNVRQAAMNEPTCVDYLSLRQPSWRDLYK